MENYPSRLRNAADRFLTLIKTKGPLSAAELASELGITSEGARLQLLKLAEEGLLQAESISKGVGRPVQKWSLTAAGNARFPDAHTELTLQFIQTIKNVLGKEALEHVVNAREKNQFEKYSKALDGVTGLENRLTSFAAIRSTEGYLAEWRKEGDTYYFIENHCPICCAATECDNICTSEMRTFVNILGEELNVSRMEHIINGARRCVYKIQAP
ncbi:Predicted transcriptional regulator, ArsR family [Chitinophaga terrae (ex Kim and Jung 2007)]|uniref:Predicted transcriptional regulator, ArsR family n=1 Tax=Chitinophaga terrae (ex Kim and Jung 2007) TaxID=408074 RepID=A0A1H4EPN8_9BACT|nr:metalloregulator ArsR/SmtB family transcription factor [Chitinophaga terrae (ex Kim and Jung 2007)]SEA86480.1 Predicted transcriptional regulator, ArsR family [Chitinophaga terrae (ex Kim and Jung 2007)]